MLASKERWAYAKFGKVPSYRSGVVAERPRRIGCAAEKKNDTLTGGDNQREGSTLAAAGGGRKRSVNAVGAGLDRPVVATRTQEGVLECRRRVA